VGDTSVGKTHMIQKYVKGYPPKNPMPTIGVEFATKTIPTSTGDRIKAQIWDTSRDNFKHSWSREISSSNIIV
jgi:GTPase SAR1 family protein